MSRCLITGGVGFIGSHIVDRLVSDGHDVVVVDNLEYQVHKGNRPDYLNAKAEYKFERLKNFEVTKDIEYVFHCASKVGVSQSQEEIYDFTDKNIGDTSHLLQQCLGSTNVKKIIHCGSMAPYGEGTHCDNAAITERYDCNPLSFYAITKFTQETMIHLLGKISGIKTISLRYFSVYGSRQALGNPYAGPIPIFIKDASRNNPLTIFGDGMQTRDFVHVSDVVDANILAMESNKTQISYNIATGKATTIKDLAYSICDLMDSKSKIDITCKHRSGDIRYSLADIEKAKCELGYHPKVLLADGLKETINWFNGGVE